MLFLVFGIIYGWLSIFAIQIGFLFVAISGILISIEVLGFIIYYFDKRAYTFSVTRKSVHIRKSWLFGTYERELTLDQIIDIHISQGTIARLFNCGTLMFVSTSGLEVGYAHSGIATGVLVGAGVGKSTPKLLSERENRFWDILNPSATKKELIDKMTQWRNVTQEKRIADNIETASEKKPTPPMTPPPITQTNPSSLVTELERLSALYEKGALTKDEYEKAKSKLLS